MTITYRQTSLAVTHKTTTLTDVLSASVTAGIGSRIATAQVEVSALPTGIVPWDAIAITMGATPATAAVRFTGYFVSADNTLHPKTTVLNCQGKLSMAQVLENPTDIDLSSSGTGATDQVMISTILYHCSSSGTWTPADAPTAMTGIGGTGETLGTVSKDRGFTWNEGETGTAFIDRLDGVCLGYRTYDTFDGTIKRTQITSIAAATGAATFTEHVDIAAANESTTILEARNKVIVTGFPGWNGNAPISYTASGGNPFLVFGGAQIYLTDSFSSQMIEKQYSASAGNGLSCEEVANWLLAEKNRYREVIELTTPRDDVIEPGDTITVVAPTRLGIATRTFWVEGVNVRMNRAGAFSQSFSCVTGIPVTLLLEDGFFLLTETGDYLESE